MMRVIIPRGDKGWNLNFIVLQSNGNIKNLVNYTITLKMWIRGISDTLILNGACEIDIASAGTCHYVIAEGDFVTVGKYVAELELTKTVGEDEIVESTKPFEIIVEESG